MNRLGQHSGWRRGLDLVGFDRGRRRSRKSRRPYQGSWVELLEDRRLLATPANSIENLTGLTISAVQNIPTTQDVATFQSADSAAVPSDFTATIGWGDFTATTAGTITEDTSGVFHVERDPQLHRGRVVHACRHGRGHQRHRRCDGRVLPDEPGLERLGQRRDPGHKPDQSVGLVPSTYTWASDEGSGLATVYDLAGPTDPVHDRHDPLGPSDRRRLQ